jgi:hypothetical protein
MVGKKLAAGWVVQLTLRQFHPDVEPDMQVSTFQFFNVAISSPDKAIDAARKKAGAPTDAPMRIVRELSHQEVTALRLHAGHVKAA